MIDQRKNRLISYSEYISSFQIFLEETKTKFLFCLIELSKLLSLDFIYIYISQTYTSSLHILYRSTKNRKTRFSHNIVYCQISDISLFHFRMNAKSAQSSRYKEICEMKQYNDKYEVCFVFSNMIYISRIEIFRSNQIDRKNQYCSIL